MKFDNKAIRNTEICKKQASKQVIQTKEAQKQTTCTSSKILQIHKKTSPNSRENRKVGNTGAGCHTVYQR